MCCLNLNISFRAIDAVLFAARLIAVLILAAAGSAIAQEKHLIDPTPPGSLNPEPLPPLQNAYGVSRFSACETKLTA
jgi:hypothetical protein